MEDVVNQRKNNSICKFLKKDLKMKCLTSYIIVNILYVFIASFLVTIKKISLGDMSKGYVALLVLNIITGIIIALKGHYKKNIIQIFLLFIVILGIISSIFAIKPKIAVWGIGGRYEGLITIIYYMSLVYLCTYIRDNYKKIIVFSIIFTGIVQCIYAIAQINDVDGVYKMIHQWNEIQFLSDGFKIPSEIWATGFATNPNFFATYMLICASLALGLYIDEKNIIKCIIYSLMMILFLFGILISNTMSCAVGFVGVLAFCFIYSIKNKKIKKILVILLLVGIVLFGSVNTKKTRLVKELFKIKDNSTEIVSGTAKKSYGTERLFIWQKTLEIVPENLLHGVGIDNYYYAFDGKALVSKDGRFYYDKAHNEYLQILVTEGIFCLIIYLAMYAVIGIRGLKYSFKNNTVYLLLPIIGYLIQAFFNISVIEVAPMFYILLGLCGSQKCEEKK